MGLYAMTTYLVMPSMMECGAGDEPRTRDLRLELRPHGAHCTMISARLPSSHGHRGTLAAPSPQHVAADDAGSVREE